MRAGCKGLPAIQCRRRSLICHLAAVCMAWAFAAARESFSLHAPAGFRTQFQGYAVRFSPFEDGKLAVATSQNYGIVGNGRQYVLQARQD